MPQKQYLGGVGATTLSSDMTDVATTFTVASGGGSGFPTGASYPFVVVIGRATPSEELILCSSRSGDTFTVSSRGYDGTTAVAHTGGPVVEHCIDAGVIDEASAHIYNTTAAHAASAISYAGGTGMSATDVEAAIDELATEKANLSGGTFTGDISVPDEAYDATAWNGSLEVPTKNAIRDKVESLGGGVTTVQATRTTGDVTMNNTGSFTADVDTGLDLVLAATAGDVVQLGLGCLVGAEAAISAFDFVTRVSAADVNFASSGTSTPYTWGVPGSRGEVSVATNVNFTTLYTVQAGDISGGNVTFRLRYKLHTATAKTLYASGGINLRVWAANFG